MFHFKPLQIITTALFTASFVLILLSKLTFVLALIALALFAVSFALLAIILFDNYKTYLQMERETKFELLMELSTTENGAEYLARETYLDKKGQKKLNAEHRTKIGLIVGSIILSLMFLVLFVLRIISIL